jgi:anti-sigma factor RsiW
MHEGMRTLLNAYLDGELQGKRLQEMETHLASCADCQTELKELRMVSEWLQADTALKAPSAERFVSQLTLKLPRRPQQDRLLKPISLAWWLVPAGLLMAWIFIQTVYTLSDVVTAANLTGLLGSASRWLGSGQESTWLSAATTLFGGQILAQPALSLLNNVSVTVVSLLGGFLWQAGIALLYLVWLCFWWFRHNPQPGKTKTAS